MEEVQLLHYRVGRFLPEGGKNVFFRCKNWTLFASKNRFLPATIGLCQNCHQSKLEP